MGMLSYSCDCVCVSLGLGYRRVRMLDDKCCGTCKYYGFENLSDGWECVNGRSEYFEDRTEYSDSCDEWEGRE
jgi:hypothetical protein